MIGWSFHFFKVLPYFRPPKEQVITKTKHVPDHSQCRQMNQQCASHPVEERGNFFQVNCYMYIFQRHSPLQRALLWCFDSKLVIWRLGRGKNGSMQGTLGRGKREEKASTPALFLFPSSPTCLPSPNIQFPIGILYRGPEFQRDDDTQEVLETFIWP